MGSEMAVARESPGDLRPQIELLEALANRIPAMLAYWDSSLRCRFANRAYERWFGVSPESLIGRHLSELLGPLWPLNLPYIEAALRGEPQEFEREIADPVGGPPRQSLAHYIPDVFEGRVRGFFVLVSDVSQVKRAEAERREFEERFRLTFEEAPIGMALVAPDGRFVRVNHVLCEIVGYSAEELTELTFQAITHPDDLNADLALVGQLARGEIPRYQLGKRYIRKDGTIVEALLSGSVLRGPDGAPRYFIAQIQDVTEQRRMERNQALLAELGPALAASLDGEAILTQVADLVVRDLADLCILEIVEEDGETRRVKVVSRDSLKSSICERLRALPLDRQRPHLMRSVLETQRPIILQSPSAEAIDAMTQSEEHREVLRSAEIHALVAVPLLAHTKLVGAMALISSTPTRTYGSSDLLLAEELAHRAALAIENARLYRAARHATCARDEMLGIVAHDLRNPLQTVLMQASLLRRGEVVSEVRAQKWAESIERAARRMSRLIEDLLDITRIDAARLTVDPTSIPADRLVLDSVDAQGQLAASASLELRVELAAQLPPVWADAHRLLQVFENLLGNALKFTPPGGRIVVGAAPRGGEVLFWVTDTGRGITPAHLPHVFERFWQIQDLERRGAGLGLPIAQGIVEAHRGRIWVESTPGRGSTFFFTIPKAPRDLDARTCPRAAGA